ncbi:MAG: FkbM family methyltransferase [Alphaproteobacteria bacterium]|nr:FkbM family methyltransferase [Alphaproteobacteria bacterium]
MAGAAATASAMVISGPDGHSGNRLNVSRDGLMLYSNRDSYIGRSLDEYGEYCARKTELLADLLEPGDVAIDVGAHIGTMTIPMAKKVGAEGVVVAYEPQRNMNQILGANAQLNGLTNVFTLHAAAGEFPGEIIVPHLTYDEDANYGALALGEYTSGEAVPLSSIDALEVNKCKVIKVAAEGMELDALRGAESTIRRLMPYIYADNHIEENSASLLQYLMDLGYQCYWNIVPLYNPQNFFENGTNVFGNTVTVAVLAVPPGEEIESESPAIASADETWHGGKTVEERAPDA